MSGFLASVKCSLQVPLVARLWRASFGGRTLRVSSARGSDHRPCVQRLEDRALMSAGWGMATMPNLGGALARTGLGGSLAVVQQRGTWARALDFNGGLGMTSDAGAWDSGGYGDNLLSSFNPAGWMAPSDSMSPPYYGAGYTSAPSADYGQSSFWSGFSGQLTLTGGGFNGAYGTDGGWSGGYGPASYGSDGGGVGVGGSFPLSPYYGVQGGVGINPYSTSISLGGYLGAPIGPQIGVEGSYSVPYGYQSAVDSFSNAAYQNDFLYQMLTPPDYTDPSLGYDMGGW